MNRSMHGLVAAEEPSADAARGSGGSVAPSFDVLQLSDIACMPKSAELDRRCGTASTRVMGVLTWR